jgi:hypothetical protein
MWDLYKTVYTLYGLQFTTPFIRDPRLRRASLSALTLTWLQFTTPFIRDPRLRRASAAALQSSVLL